MVGGTWSSSNGSKIAFAVAARASRRTLSSRAFGADRRPRRAAITNHNNSRSAIDPLAAIKYDLLAAIVVNSSMGAFDPLAAIKYDPLAAIAN